MKKTTIITVACFVLGLILLTMGFILLTDNNISNIGIGFAIPINFVKEYLNEINSI